MTVTEVWTDADEATDSTTESSPDVETPERFEPGIPSVNLLPPTLREGADVRRAIGQAVAGLALTAGLIGAAFLGQQGLLLDAANDLDTAQAAKSQADAQQAKFAPYDAYYKSVEAKRTQISELMAKESSPSTILRSLQQAAGSGVTFSSIKATMDTAPSATAADAAAAPSGAVAATGVDGGCVSPDLFNPAAPAGGCVIVNGTADSRGDVTRLLTSLGTSKTFANPFVSATQVDADGKTTFTMSVGLTQGIFTGRYANIDFLKGTGQ